MAANPQRRSTPSTRHPAAVAALRTALHAADFTFDTVRSRLGADESLNIPPHQVPVANQRLGDTRLGHLIRLFVIGTTITPDQAARALAPLTLPDAVAIGAVVLGRSRVHGALRLLPLDRYVFASDPDTLDPSDLTPDFVLGVTESSRLLGDLTVRRPVERALDLGTGCGYQAILAAQHAGTVVATDVNPRCLAMARFNALLNGVDNIEFREGDRFDPVNGETFDLIVSNPPFVISPERAFTYRDSGLRGDEVSRGLVQDAPRFLRPGGFANLLGSWIHDTEPDGWTVPLVNWVAESGCDAWFLRKGSYDPLAYAVMWNQRLALANQMQKYLDGLQRWTRYFEQLGAQALGWGAIWLRRGETATPHLRADDLPEKVEPRTAEELVGLLEVDDQLQALSDEALLARRVRVADEQRLEQVLRWREGAFRIVEATLVRERGLGPRAEIDPALAALLAHADGERSIDEVLAGTARAIGGDPDTLRVQGLQTIRAMLSHGFLVLPD